MKHYDFIIAGGGAAGLSLAYHLSLSSLRNKSILIVDRETKTRNDRTWCFWTTRPTYFEPITYRSWNRVDFFGSGATRRFDLAPYKYNLIRGLDFYDFTREELSSSACIDFLTAPVLGVQDHPTAAVVTAGSDTFTADFVFDSRYRMGELPPRDPRHHYLLQHFLGWEIETPDERFDPGIPTLFDFRTPQNGRMSFFYVLPFSPTRALVEYTLFSPTLLPAEEYTMAMRSYLAGVLNLSDYNLISQETGVIPMTDFPFRRRAGARIFNIGTRGGRVKPSSGFAFMRIQQDSAAIVRSLDRFGHPFIAPRSAARYQAFDRIMLQVLSRHGDMAEKVFSSMFLRNPIQRIFRFLDESASPFEDAQLMSTMPVGLFVKAALKLWWTGRS